MEIRGAVEVGQKLLQILEAMFWKGQKEHPEKTELLEALQTLISHVQSAEKEIEEIKHYQQIRELALNQTIKHLESQLAAKPKLSVKKWEDES